LAVDSILFETFCNIVSFELRSKNKNGTISKYVPNDLKFSHIVGTGKTIAKLELIWAIFEGFRELQNFGICKFSQFSYKPSIFSIKS